MKKILLFVALSALVSCAPQSKEQTLKSAYKDYFPIGVALGENTFKDAKQDSLISLQFSSVTAENCMKPHQIGVAEGEYNFEPADCMLDYVEENGMVMRGHTLLWHSAAPDWFFAPDKDGNEASKELILSRLERYITDVVTHFKGRVYCYDVVNEAISDNPNHYLRQNSVWYKHFGDSEFIEMAFKYAHAADPDALLFYNDYSVVNASKRANIINLVKELQAKDTPIHGIGIQGHWNIASPTREELVATIEDVKALGLKVQVTELDVRVNPHWAGGALTIEEDKKHAIYEFTPELSAKLTAQYKMIFDTFREYRDVLSGVTFWNLYDGNTWLDRRQGNLGKNYPLLFDENMQPKEAYSAVVNF